MTSTQFDKVMYQSHEVLDDQGIVAVKIIFSAYNLADGFEKDYMDVIGFRQYLTRRNRVFVYIVHNMPDIPGDPHEMLGYVLATAEQYSAQSIKFV